MYIRQKRERIPVARQFLRKIVSYTKEMQDRSVPVRTYEILMIRELFSIYKKASDALGMSKRERYARITEISEKLVSVSDFGKWMYCRMES